MNTPTTGLLPTSIMTAPNFSSDVNHDLIRRIIDARIAYEKLCGSPPTCIHVKGPILVALAERGLKEGGQVAGMKIIARVGAPADEAICSRDEHLFTLTMPAVKPSRARR
jgi:hypothetical protein